MWIFLGYCIFSFLLASYAKANGRSFWIWFIIPIIFDPVCGFVFYWISGFFLDAFHCNAEKELDEKVKRMIQERQCDPRNVN